MSLTSMDFFFFIMVMVMLYYITPVRYRWGILLIGSCYFITKSNGMLPSVVMLGEIGFTYIVACIFGSPHIGMRMKRWILIVCIFILMALLILLKEVELKITAPVGISYYTLFLISYLCDVYWGTAQAEKNLFRFAEIAGFFPVLISGPILRYGSVEKQFYKENYFHFSGMKRGILRILWGIFKKLVIAERIAVIVNEIYGNYQHYYGLYIWFAVVLFTLQLYADFSGCMDIVIGVSGLFGIELPENFHYPFTAKNLSEFWRRWHITLGEWLRDYVFYPILKSQLWQVYGTVLKRKFGKKYGKKIPVWTALLISWFLIGTWHGGGWNYIFGVGIFMGVSIILGEAFQPLFTIVIARLKIRTECFSWRLFQAIRSSLLFVFGNSFFRAENLEQGFSLWKQAFALWNPWILFDGSILGLGLNAKNINVLLAALGILAAGSVTGLYLKRPISEWLEEQNYIFQWTVVLVGFFVVMTYGCYGSGYNAQDFIYAGF